MSKNEVYICLDFDGTVIDTKTKKPVPDALMFVKSWMGLGAKIILWTVREGEDLKWAVDYLKSNGVELFGINTNPAKKWRNRRKAFGIYVDDMAVGCPVRKYNGLSSLCVDWSAVGPRVDRWLRKGKKGGC